ncbi:MAG: alpha-L-arabinofuranosidase C-terminal domain-containing protein, partial [Anaerolineae bacterium]
TEYNFVVAEHHTPTDHYGMSLDQGLYIADMLRHLIELQIPLANLHTLIAYAEVEGWPNTAALSPSPHFVRRPESYVLELFTHHFAPVPVESEMQDAPLLTGSVPALEVIASTDEAGERLTLLAVNKETTATITATVVISGFTPAATATVWTLNGPDIAAFNDAGHPTDVVTTESAITDAGERFVYPFPAHSVTVIELRRVRQIWLPLLIHDSEPIRRNGAYL